MELGAVQCDRLVQCAGIVQRQGGLGLLSIDFSALSDGGKSLVFQAEPSLTRSRSIALMVAALVSRGGLVQLQLIADQAGQLGAAADDTMAKLIDPTSAVCNRG